MDKDEFILAYGTVLDHYAQEDMESPMTVVTVGTNGMVMIDKLEISEGKKTITHLGGHMESEGWALPLNIMVVDARGKSYRGKIRDSRHKGGPPKVTWLH